MNSSDNSHNKGQAISNLSNESKSNKSFSIEIKNSSGDEAQSNRHNADVGVNFSFQFRPDGVSFQSIRVEARN